jgi:hypothetical protein
LLGRFNVTDVTTDGKRQDNESDGKGAQAQQIQQYLAIKPDLIDFVLDAEGDIATALEAFSAQQLSRWATPNLAGLNRSELAIDMFVTEGRVGTSTILDLFVEANPALAAETQTLLKHWALGFNGLFVVRSVDSELDAADKHYTVMNWLTEKQYSVWPVAAQAPELLARISVGEIVLARLLPLIDSSSGENSPSVGWTFSGPLTLLGKLGKPKLAVAIGNFKKWFPQHLYGDAPELKEAAWESVKQQHTDFVALFGAEQVTLSGHELNKKFQQYQASTTDKQLAEAGLDSSKSLAEMATDAGVSKAEVEEAIAALGEENIAAKKLMESGRSLKMVMPKVSLPDEYRSAKSVTVFIHPRWGQMLLTDYSRLEAQLMADEGTDEAIASLDRLIRKYLESEQANAYVWEQLAKAHPKPIESSLRRVLNRPEFEIERDLESALAKYGKPLTPTLPESASVPVHLHNLFQEALQAVGKGAKPKDTGKKKATPKKSGFGK